jgi:tRNA ligase
MGPVYSVKDNKLIHELIRVSQKNPKLIKGSDYVAPEAPEMTIRSWKMNEHKYYDVPSPFPTLARGLFTTAADEGGNALAGRRSTALLFEAMTSSSILARSRGPL